MSINYKISNLYDDLHMINLQDPNPDIEELIIFDILEQLQHFEEFDAEQQNSILLNVRSIFNQKNSIIFTNSEKMQIISQFISDFIAFSQCSCSIIIFLQFFSEWTFYYDVEDDLFANKEETLSFILFHSTDAPFLGTEVQVFSLSILLNLVNDSKIMRNILIENCLNDESQLSMFINIIETNKNQLVEKIIFRIFNIILKFEEIDNINFKFVIDNLITASLPTLFFDSPNERIEFVYLYLMKCKNEKKHFFSDLISKISYKNIYKSVNQFDDEKNGEFFSFLQSLIDNNEWENEFHVNIDFDSIIKILKKNQEKSFNLQKKFCELLISYFSHPSIYEIDYDYEQLFDFLFSMTKGDFKLLDYVLSVYYTIFESSIDLTFFNPLKELLSNSQNSNELLNFFADFFESDCEDHSKKAFRIILSIMQLLSNFDYLIEQNADQIKSIIQDILFGDRFDSNENENIIILQENFCEIFPNENETDQ